MSYDVESLTSYLMSHVGENTVLLNNRLMVVDVVDSDQAYIRCVPCNGNNTVASFETEESGEDTIELTTYSCENPIEEGLVEGIVETINAEQGIHVYVGEHANSWSTPTKAFEV